MEWAEPDSEKMRRKMRRRRRRLRRRSKGRREPAGGSNGEDREVKKLLRIA